MEVFVNIKDIIAIVLIVIIGIVIGIINLVNKFKKKKQTMNKFECSECGTKYSSPETTPPPGIKWSDGHICTPKPVNKQLWKKNLYLINQVLI